MSDRLSSVVCRLFLTGALLSPGGFPSGAQGVKPGAAPATPPGPPAVSQEREPEERLPAAQRGRIMLPETQRLLESRLETPSWRPFNGFGVRSLGERGPAGWLDLSLGVSVGGRAGFRNLALNGELALAPWLRTHLTAVARPHATRLSSERLLQEAYLEAFDTWRLGDGEFGTSLKAGTTQNVSFPYPDALSLFDWAPRSGKGQERDFRGYKHLVGVADYAHRSGLGLHAAASKRVTHDPEGSDTRAHMIDYYLRYRGEARGLSLEARLGALNPARALGPEALPNRPRSGQAIYVGKDWGMASAGLMMERTGGSPVRYGIRLNVPLGPGSEVLGNFLGRYRRSERTATAQIPLGSLVLGQRFAPAGSTEPPVDGELVGTIRATRVYRTGAFQGLGDYPLNYEYVLDREGETKGSGLTRVLAEGPRYLWDGGALGGGRAVDGERDDAQLFSTYRQDVTYNFYRPVRSGVARLTGRVVDAEHPERSVAGARVTRLEVPVEQRLLPVTGGAFRLEEKVRLSQPRAVKLMASAPGYLDEVATVTLKGGESQTVDIRLKAAMGGLSVQLLDAETGEPIREAEVHVTAPGGKAGEAKPKVLLTDEQGTVRAGPLAPGRYSVSTYAPRYYDQKAETLVATGGRPAGGGGAATTAPDASAAGQGSLVLRLKPRPGSIAGKVVDRAGKPVVGAAVTITDGEGRGFGALTTLRDGTFGTTGLEPGRYTVAVRGNGNAKAEAAAEVRAGEIETVEIALP